MNPKLLMTAVIVLITMDITAQNIDFDLPGKTTPGKDTEVNYISWPVPRAKSDTKTFDNGMTITISAGGAAKDVGSNWSKTDVETNGLRIIADEVLATNLVNGNLTQITEGSTSLILTITGMTAGQHSLKAYHNNSDKDQVQPDIQVSVNGNVVSTGVKFTSAARSNTEAGMSFVTFDATEGQPVVITYSTTPEAGKTYTNTRVMLNGLEFDVAEITATDPQPANRDFHAGTDDGTVSFSWTAPTGVVSHKMVLGTDSAQVANATRYEYEGTAAAYVKSGLSSMQKYWWRIDEVDGEGTIHKGAVWTFRPRHLAFPDAEGYGRYAIGGRGGVVYHVTSLSGGKEPGTLLYGLTEMDEPRYIVFDVSGIIELDFSSHFTKPYAYIAGQTAPGKGICIKASNINIGSDVICRHMRFKRGLGVYGKNTGNAMGMTGADHSIVDHCTAAWGTDETVSGRGALNISFQYSIISEALGIAGHKNYADGTNHGYAATIDGRIGSWHHNLLVNCNGRNWSMGGGMDGQNRPIGGLDLFNNVCYNWYGRTTDGNCHAVNFVNNYYKMGADTKKTILFTQEFEDAIAPDGIDQAYVNGNIRENKNHTQTKDAKNETYNATGRIPTTYDYLVNEPLFPSYATIHSALDAMKIVTSYSGATMPMRDEHHQRNIRETLNGTWTYKGSRSGIKGEIDTEEDITEHAAGKGWEDYPEEHRAADWDTDGDGMPDWWEQCTGSNPNTANQNDDPDGDGWTLLEDYLEFMAHPYIMIESGGQGTIDLRQHFAGFFGQNSNAVEPTFTCNMQTDNGVSVDINGTTMLVTVADFTSPTVLSYPITVSDGESTFTQRFGVVVLRGTSGTKTTGKVHTLGDSTMAPYDESATVTRGWGMYFGQFLTNGWTSVNYAKGGRDSRGGYNELWQTAKKNVEAGDYVIIQFAHNDEKINGMDRDEVYNYYISKDMTTEASALDSRGTTPSTTYKTWLGKIVDEVQALGAHPILVGAACRAYFSGGKIRRNGRHDLGDSFSKLTANGILEKQSVPADDHLMDYTYHMEQLANEKQIPFVNLTAATAELYESYGEKKCLEYLFDGQGSTHFNTTGAVLVARKCAELMKSQDIMAENITLPSDLSVTPADGDFGEAYMGQTLQKEFTLNGFGLQPEAGSVTITATEGITLSFDKKEWTSTLTADYTASTLVKTFYVQLSLTESGEETGTVTIQQGIKTIEIPVKANAITLEGGTEVKAYWRLEKDDSYELTGPAVAIGETFEGMYVQRYSNPNAATVWPDWTGYDASRKMQRNLLIGDAWPADEIDDNPARYIQWGIQPAAGTELKIDEISLFVSGCGGNGMCCHIYYSTDNFETRTTIFEYKKMPSNNPQYVEAKPVITLKEDQQLLIRVYPWYNGAATGKTICLSDLTIHGMAVENTTGIVQRPMVNYQEPTAIYTLDGRQQPTLRRGLNIVRLANGTIRKIVI